MSDEWESQTLAVMMEPCADGRLMVTFSTLEHGLDRRIYFTALQWHEFKAAGDQHMQQAQTGL